MSILIDTNVLLRLAQPSSPDHASARAAVLELLTAGIEACIVPQVIYEYWVVATRPTSGNGLGMAVTDVESSIGHLLFQFTLRKDERGIFKLWKELVITYDVKGKTAHDARLVAAMQRHGITHLLTYNTQDFSRFPGIHAHSPAQIAAGPLPNFV